MIKILLISIIRIRDSVQLLSKEKFLFFITRHHCNFTQTDVNTNHTNHGSWVGWKNCRSSTLKGGSYKFKSSSCNLRHCQYYSLGCVNCLVNISNPTITVENFYLIFKVYWIFNEVAEFQLMFRRVVLISLPWLLRLKTFSDHQHQVSRQRRYSWVSSCFTFYTLITSAFWYLICSSEWCLQPTHKSICSLSTFIWTLVFFISREFTWSVS